MAFQHPLCFLRSMGELVSCWVKGKRGQILWQLPLGTIVWMAEGKRNDRILKGRERNSQEVVGLMEVRLLYGLPQRKSFHMF